MSKPKAVYESTLAKLKADDEIERKHTRRKLWRKLKAGLGWFALMGLLGSAWHEILVGAAKIIGRR